MNIEELRNLLIENGEKTTERHFELLNKMSKDAANGKASITAFINIKKQDAISDFIDYLIDVIDGKYEIELYDEQEW